MSGTIPLEDAQATLPELIANLTPGEEIVITQNQQPVARLLRVPSQPQRQLGTLRGSVLSMDAGFDMPLDDFKEYME